MYPLGNTIILSAIFRNTETGQLLDPTTVRCVVKRKATGAVETPYVFGVDSALVRKSVGTYDLTLKPAQTGTWLYKWIGLGPSVDSLEKGQFKVIGDGFA